MRWCCWNSNINEFAYTFLVPRATIYNKLVFLEHFKTTFRYVTFVKRQESRGLIIRLEKKLNDLLYW